MGKINVLDMSVANMIAAGEVVERPASAIKELVENSIDAGAHQITVEIKRGGVSFLRVTDDGCGMSDTDAVACLQRHATSKIRTADDLTRILTLGFRGEALAAISSVTAMRIMTRLRGAEMGTLVRCDYGQIVEIAEGGYPEGTTVICENLFARVPARLKFLKADQAEGMAVASLMEKMALSHPEISFRFFSDETLRFQTTGDGKTENAIYAVLGKAFSSHMIQVDAKSGGIAVSGYISAPDFVRGNRNLQMFFINSRLVRSKSLTAALENACNSFIPIGKFPSCVLFIKLHASTVDVNIHPAKLEVKFSNEKEVFDAVYYSVRGALESKINRPALDIIAKASVMTEEKLKVVSGFASIEREKPERISLSDTIKPCPPVLSKETTPVSDKPESEHSLQTDTGFHGKPKTTPLPKTQEKVFAVQGDVPTEELFPSRPLHEKSTFDFAAGTFSTRVSAPVDRWEKETVCVEENKSAVPLKAEREEAPIAGATAHEIPPYKIIGEVWNSYIVLEVGEKMMLVDKHAAHERINYERFRANMQEAAPAVQMLLTPVILSLSQEEKAAVSAFGEEIVSVGFLFDVSENELIIRGVPPETDTATAKDLLETLVTAATEDGAALTVKKRTMFERALYSASCKAAVKAGRVYDEVHIRWICDNLLRYDCIKYCPHGRPCAFEITKAELSHRFGRT